VDSKAKLDHCRLAVDFLPSSSSSAKCRNILCNGLTDVTASPISGDVDTDAVSTECMIPSIGDGLTPEFNIQSAVIHSLTCFIAAE